MTRVRLSAKRSAALSAVLALALTAPSAFADRDAASQDPPTGDAALVAGVPLPGPGSLSPFADYTELTEHMRSYALARLAERRPDPLERGAGAAGPAGPSAPGPDEPARARTDGRLLVSLLGRSLQIFDVGRPTESPAAGPAARGALDLGGLEPSGLLFAGDRALVLGARRDRGGPGQARSGERAHPVGLALVDLADPDRPRLLAQEALTGRVVTARVVDGTARVVLAGSPFVPQRLSAARNRITVLSAPVEAWLPSRRTLDADGRAGSARPLVGCSDVLRPAATPGLDLLSVLTLDLRDATSPEGAELAGEATSVVGAADLVHASAERLYVATNPAPRGSRQSAVHVFDTAVGGRTAYAGSGVVAGRVPGPWTMSEHGRDLRVLALRAGPEGSRVPQADLVVLRREGTALAEAGRLPDVGLGERVYAVRWAEDSAAVVTSRRMHTLSLVDLSEPASPAQAGALDVPWFEDHLHAIGDFRLLGVGPTGGGPGRGLQVSAYDVIDPMHPGSTGAAQYRASHASSGAEFDPRRLVFLPEAQIAVLPASWRIDRTAGCTQGRCPADIDRGRFNGLVAVSVKSDGTLVREGQWRSQGAAAGAWSSAAPALQALGLPDGRVAALDARGLTVLEGADLTVRGFAPYAAADR